MNDLTLIEKEFGSLDRWRQGPEFWVSTPARGLALLPKLPGATVRTIGRSAGGRDLLALEYGEREPLDHTMDNLQSALASNYVPPDPTDIYPAAFYGKRRRRRPVLALQGAIHGDELTGTVASFNLCHVLETGHDLRGKAWPRLRELARATRLLFIPWLNRDGAERSPVVHHSGLPADLGQVLVQGVKQDGTKLRYPAVKSLFPIPVAEMAYLGTYYNDAGVNLQYDFCRPHRQPETVAWMEYYLAERPDAVLIWHCNAGSLIGPPCYYLPPGCQFTETRLAGAVRARLQREGFRAPQAGRLSWADLPGMGKPYLEQMSATYHVCGGLPIMCELPSGCQEWFCSCDDMLDIGLLVLEEVLAFAHSDGLRPYEFWEKARAKLG